jgi:AAA+ superfamily predicted ATPase
MIQPLVNSLIYGQTGNISTIIYLGIMAFFGSYLIKIFHQIKSYVQSLIQKHVTNKKDVGVLIDSPHLVQCIFHKIKKESSNDTNNLYIKFDNFNVQKNKIKIDVNENIEGVTYDQYKNIPIKIIDNKNKLHLQIYNYHITWSNIFWPKIDKRFTNINEKKIFIEEYITYCIKVYEKDNEDMTTNHKRIILQTWANNRWNNKLEIPSRSRATVIGNSCTKIMKDVQSFIDDYDFYNKHDIPYKRSYLLHGPPGTGKTTIIRAVATEFNRGIYQINLSEKGLTKSDLNNAFSTIPNKSIVAIEDIDSSFLVKKKDETDINENNHVTYSDILNILDGISSAYGNIIFITSNHIEKIGKSLLRPGRIDIIEYVPYADKDFITTYLKNFYKDSTSDIIEKLAEQMINYNENIVPAEIQNHVIQYRNNIQDCIDNIDKFRDENYVYYSWSNSCQKTKHTIP